jgi:hypothetical protein
VERAAARAHARLGVRRSLSDDANISAWHIVRSFEIDAPGAEFGASSTSFFARIDSSISVGTKTNAVFSVFRDGALATARRHSRDDSRANGRYDAYSTHIVPAPLA